MLFPQIFKNYEISTNVTDKNTNFTTKSEGIVICGSCEIYIISICGIYMFTVYTHFVQIYMFTVCTHFVQCIKIVSMIRKYHNVQRLQYCMILFHVSESNA